MPFKRLTGKFIHQIFARVKTNPSHWHSSLFECILNIFRKYFDKGELYQWQHWVQIRRPRPLLVFQIQPELVALLSVDLMVYNIFVSLAFVVSAFYVFGNVFSSFFSSCNPFSYSFSAFSCAIFCMLSLRFDSTFGLEYVSRDIALDVLDVIQLNLHLVTDWPMHLHLHLP